MSETENTSSTETSMLDKVKVALRLTVDNYDSEVQALIDAALLDLGIAGVTGYDEDDALILQAVKVYCCAHFGNPPNYDKLAQCYDQLKGALQIASGYTEWGVVE